MIMKVHANGFTIRDMKTRWEAVVFTVKDSMNLQLAVNQRNV